MDHVPPVADKMVAMACNELHFPPSSQLHSALRMPYTGLNLGLGGWGLSFFDCGMLRNI